MLVIPFLDGSASFSFSLSLRKRFRKNQGLITGKNYGWWWLIECDS